MDCEEYRANYRGFRSRGPEHNAMPRSWLRGIAIGSLADAALNGVNALKQKRTVSIRLNIAVRIWQ